MPYTTDYCNFKVLEYLSKKGYSRTEAMLRKESANVDADGRPVPSRAEDTGGRKYHTSFELTLQWIDNVLDIPSSLSLLLLLTFVGISMPRQNCGQSVAT